MSTPVIGTSQSPPPRWDVPPRGISIIASEGSAISCGACGAFLCLRLAAAAPSAGRQPRSDSLSGTVTRSMRHEGAFESRCSLPRACECFEAIGAGASGVGAEKQTIVSFDRPPAFPARADAQGVAPALGVPMHAMPVDLLGSLRPEGFFKVPRLVSASVAGRFGRSGRRADIGRLGGSALDHVWGPKGNWRFSATPLHVEGFVGHSARQRHMVITFSLGEIHRS